ncbi:MAG: ATP-dependent helicase, partial [Pseudomonadota bacterium]
MELNLQQKTAVEHSGCHVLVLAGAGTGKTNTIISRAAYLIRQKVEPKRILMLTFTRRAAKEMASRLSRMVDKDTHDLMAGTFHHFCLYSMRRMPKVFALEQSTVIDRDDQLHLMKLVRAGFVKKGEQFPKANVLVDLYSYARNTNQSPLQYLKKYTEHDNETIDLLLKVFAEYDSRKKAHNYLDYDDILFLFAKQLHEDPAVRDRLKGLYDHILVDEMQDTNPLQWLILDGLRDPALLFCVGDDAQSIYAFRGADFKNVHSFTKRVPGSAILKLEENYRSTQGILDLSNWLLKESTLTYDKKLKAHRGAGIKPRLVDCESDFHEARWITDDLLDRHESGAVWKDHMIITRTAFAARTLETSLIEKKIPYRFIGGTSFIQAAHIKDLFSLIRSASSHGDQIAWIRYLTLFPKIGDVKASRIIAAMGKQQKADAALECLSGSKSIAPDTKETIMQGISLVAKNRDNPEKALQAAADFLDPLLKERYEKWDMRRKDFNLLIKLAKNYKSLLSL